MDIPAYIATAVGAYLLGSVPFGFLMGRLRGIDIRKEGSGNIGATNVLRILGKPAGITVLVLDGLKGFSAAAWWVMAVQRWMHPAPTHAESLTILAGVSAVIGHNYTCWLRFRGGKGIATSAGVLAAWVPYPLLIIAVVWFTLTLLTGFVSLGSIAASATLPFACWLTHESPALILVTSILSIMAIYKHRTNIRRLLNGTESRLHFRKKGVSQ